MAVQIHDDVAVPRAKAELCMMTIYMYVPFTCMMTIYLYVPSTCLLLPMTINLYVVARRLSHECVCVV